MQDIAPFSYQHTRYSTKAHDIFFFFKLRIKLTHIYAGRKKTKPKYLRQKEEKKAFHFTRQFKQG